MPRRTSSRLRGGAAPAASAAAAGDSDGEGSGGGGGGCPFPPSPGKRKARSPVEEDHGQLAAGLANPHPLRSPSFQSPKKRAQGIGDRFSAAPFDKENDLRLSSSSSSISLGGGMFSAPLSADGGAAGAFRLSAFSAFSQHASPRLKNEQSRGGGGRRRGRGEETAADPLQSTAAEAVADAPSTPRGPTAGPAGKDSSMLPFLLAPASVTSSPDLRRKASSRRAPRSTRSTNTNCSSSSSSSGGGGIGMGIGIRRSREGSSPSPPLIPPLPGVPSGTAAAAAADGAASPAAAVGTSSPRDPSTSTPRKGRYSFRSGAGCAAGGRRAATIAAAAAAAATSSSAESMSATSPTDVNSGGGGPAGSYRRAVGGGRLGAGGGGGGDTMSDHSPRRSPVHCLTESLQKWDPGSRYVGPADDNNHNNIEERGAGAGDGEESSCAAAGGAAAAAGGGGAAAGVAGATTKEVGASWNGQELRRTLEKERMGRGRRRRHSITSTQDMYPQARFGDHSPISPASSAASIALEGFEASPPVSAGRPWRSSPRRVEGVGGGGASSGGGSGRRASGSGSNGSGSCRRGDGAGAGDEAVGSAHHFGIVRMEGSWSDDDTGPSGTVMKLAFSPRKITADARTPTTGGKGLTSPPFSVESPAPLSKSGDSSTSTEGTTEESHHPASPEQPSLGSMRDLMDEGTDDEEEGGGGGNHGGGDGDSRAALVRRRRRRPRPEVALRTLEMPDAMDTEGGPTAAATAAAAAGAESSSATVAAASKSTPNPLVSPAAFAGKHLGGGGGAGFGSGCTTARRPWEGPAPLEGSSICTQGTPGTAVAAMAASSSVTTADDSWIHERGSKAKGRGDWGGCSSSSGFGAAAEDAQQDVSGGEGNSSGMMTTLGLSGLSGLADTSGASEASTLFVKSRPIPDQSAFTSSRFTKVGAHSPLVGSSGGGPAPGGPAAPVCLTPRKSMMRCPPTPQRTPTWESEDSLLLEGAGSGGGRAPRGGGISAGGLLSSSRSCLLQSKLLASSSSDDAIVDAAAGGSGTGVAAIDVVLANASSSSSSSPGGAAARRSSPRLEAAAAAAVDGGGPAAAAASGSGGRYDGSSSSSSSSSFGGASGRGGRGRGGRERLSAGGTNTGGRGNGSRFASVAEPAPAVGAAASSGGDGVVVGAGPLAAGASAAAAATATDSTLGFKHDFVQMGPIGEGGFSVVWKVRAKGTGRLYAIKRSKREFRGRRDRDRCLLEAKALQRLGQHPGVLRFERAWQEEGHFCLQTEICELGTLKDFLERLPSRREIPEPAVWQVLQDIGQALSHVHAMGLVHLDVKPSNLLIGDEGGRLKLADFGMATAYGEGVEGVGDGQEGDTLYMAKELLSSTARLPSADMFSLGLTVYEVATRIELPGDGEDWHAMRDGRAVGLPSSRSRDLGDVLRQV
ncbi:unnamed protein product, partial [Ectocarpus sp. 8 AP-2014]